MNKSSLLFSQFPVLAGVDDQTQQAIAAHAHKRTYRAGQMIALQGDPSQAAYLVVDGRLRGQRCSVEGREYVLYDLGPGECVNFAAVLDGGYNLATVTAVSDAVLYAIPAADLRRILGEHPALALALLSHLTRRVRHLSDAVEGLALYDVRIRLARCLVAYTHRGKESEAAQGEARLCPPYLTQGELAAQIGSVRDVVGRTLRSFSREGLIRRERGRVVIIDLVGLRREALLQQPARLAS